MASCEEKSGHGQKRGKERVPIHACRTVSQVAIRQLLLLGSPKDRAFKNTAPIEQSDGTMAQNVSGQTQSFGKCDCLHLTVPPVKTFLKSKGTEKINNVY
jgi:hypothetical protein